MIIINKDKIFEDTNFYTKENCFENGMILIIDSSFPKQYSLDGGTTWKEMEINHI